MPSLKATMKIVYLYYSKELNQAFELIQERKKYCLYFRFKREFK